MSKYTLSNKAAHDLENIYQYTFREFGEHQADSYLNELEACFNLLADETEIAQKANEIREEYYRYPFRKHSIFFKLKDKDIFVVRVLHQQMKYELHLTS